MSKRENELFAEWGEELASDLAAEDQEAFQKWLTLPVAREVFRGTVGQKELYRRMNEIHAEKEKLDEDRQALEAWYDEEAPKNAALIAERDALRAQSFGSTNPPPSAASGFTLSAEDLAELKEKARKVDVLDKLVPAVLGDIGQIVKESIRDGFDIDPREVIQVSIQRGMPPYSAYLQMTQEVREQRATEARDAELKKAFDDGRRSVQSNSPDHFAPSGPSVVDFINELNKGTRVESTQNARVADALKELSAVGSMDLS